MWNQDKVQKILDTDPDSDSESRIWFVPYPELLTWNLDKQQDVSLLDDDKTVVYQDM